MVQKTWTGERLQTYLVGRWHYMKWFLFFSPKLLCAAVANFNSRHTLMYRTSACQPHREVRALPHSCVKILEAWNSYKWSINFPRKYQNKWPSISMPSVCWAPTVCEVFLAHASWPHNDSRRQIWNIPLHALHADWIHGSKTTCSRGQTQKLQVPDLQLGHETLWYESGLRQNAYIVIPEGIYQV